MNTEFNAMLFNSMANVFGAEWGSLTIKQQDLVLGDLLSDPELTIPEYKKNIGEGNLAKYVKCLEIK